MSAVRFDPEADPTVYLYVRVADHLSQRIAAGELPAGSALPAEPALARGNQISVGTVRNAMKTLRHRALVITLPGKGTFVAGPPGQEE